MTGGGGRLWGARFAADPDPDFLSLTSSMPADLRLLQADVAATRAHARVLVESGLLTKDDADGIDAACSTIVEDWRAETIAPDAGDEDVHSLVQRLLVERAGEPARRIHAGRSRNDLVAMDLRLWCATAASELARATAELIGVIADVAEAHRATTMPGYTHLQRAQPVSLGFHLLGHGFALLRDVVHFEQASESAAVGVLGAGALATSTLDLDPGLAAHELGLDRTFDNAIDAVSDRDFACDLVYAAALCGVHLSRLAEEIVLWTSSEFGFARLDDAWSTGSSMMPQKRNPDGAELVRGRSAGGIANLVGILTMLKGLPLAYDRDLQEDKTFVFAAVDTIASSLQLVAGTLTALEFDTERMERAAASGPLWATDVAEALVARGLPWRDAHAAAGRLVALLEQRGIELADASDEMLASVDPALDASVRGLADPRLAVERRSGRGGPAPEKVDEQLGVLRGAIDRWR